jgi:hypothetical protein
LLLCVLNRVMRKAYFAIAATFIIMTTANGQMPNASGSDLMKYIAPAPDSIFKKFRDAGMNPSNHPLTEAERVKVEEAFSVLPPLHRKILRSHLHSLSFMDNMPNTALTSPVVGQDSVERFNITFRSGILHETISEWATKKENVLFDRSENNGYTVSIEAGNLDAFVYVLLHEATHVVDAVLKLTPRIEKATDTVAPTVMTKGIWRKLNVPVEQYMDSLVEKTIFRGGVKISIASAPEIYRTLSKMPFVSLYAMASWSEDIAELETIYHLTHKIKQPFYVIIRKGNDELARFEPMKRKLVQKRLRHLKVFYQ